MEKLTHAAILARATRDCQNDIDAGMYEAREWERMGRQTEATFYYDSIVKHNEEELEVLKQLYRIETGTDY